LDGDKIAIGLLSGLIKVKFFIFLHWAQNISGVKTPVVQSSSYDEDSFLW
jgi:hypothetical protein